ncbi:23S rRNA (adenine(2030)-N(6))-methyltransferase RlmJ [Siculibacillus lacustris]|uniref:Ribosomal RNA large subunit methyltransferase J n=1 Tax=Siculibacillus lacustris TaxID=1549641 RepID=A0A4Q9VHS2_9HYPH|nr:23S rRNA (adenine(2030)-N(6))-methyltransferase RlmJ [Siculibacillus lacustris]TBW34714.1 23S rRNA (adenine(2030)-N(6))-methyltransferase RlmJ [Siculibacillus lacustris]
MNYRHAFHAGNFADVVKHAILARILVHLAAKPAPFRVIDTHAGIGLYDLAGSEARRTGEWRGGIGRLLAAPLPDAAAALLEPYLAAVATTAGVTTPSRLDPAHLATYPGSPLIVRAGLRRVDRATAVELHPADAATLAALFAGDARLKVVELDGWLALKSFLPPKERRGLVLIDPPFENVDEFDRVVRGLIEATQRFANGIYMVWHPIKGAADLRRHHQDLVDTGLRRILTVEFAVDRPDAEGPLVACGLTIVNPPWTLPEELDVLLPALIDRLAIGPDAFAGWRWLVPE